MWSANLFLYRDLSVYLQEPHPKRRAGQSFSNCGLKITYIVWEWTSSLSGSVNRRINREWQRFSLSNMQGKKGSKRIEMIIKMVNEFKLTVVHFARPNPMQICACAWIYRWTKKLWAVGRGPAFSKTLILGLILLLSDGKSLRLVIFGLKWNWNKRKSFLNSIR